MFSPLMFSGSSVGISKMFFLIIIIFKYPFPGPLAKGKKILIFFI